MPTSKHPDTSAYSKHFSVPALWKKITAAALKAGKKMIRLVLLLFYVLIDHATPHTIKAIIIAPWVTSSAPLMPSPISSRADTSMILPHSPQHLPRQEPSSRKNTISWQTEN